MRRAAWLVVLGALALTVGLARYTAANLGVHTDTSEMFDAGVDFRRHLEEFKELFPQFTDVLVAVVDAPSAAEARRAADDIAERCATRPDLFRNVYWPGSEEYFRRNGLLFLSTDELRELTTELRRTAPLFAHLRQAPTLARLAEALTQATRLAGERLPPSLTGVLAGIDASLEARLAGRARPFDWQAVLGGGLSATGTEGRELVLLQPVLDYESFTPGAEAIAFLRASAEALRVDSDSSAAGVRVRLTGDVALSHEELQSAQDGAMLAGTISVVLVSFALVAGLRSWRMIAAALVTLVLGLVWTAGFATFAVGHLNLISIAFAVLYISLGIDYSIHFCLRLRELQAAGEELGPALEDTMSGVGSSLVLAAFTTSLGFFSFVPTEFAGVRELGVIAGGGTIISLLANLTLLPALLSLPGLAPQPRPVVRPQPAGIVATLLGLPLRWARGLRWAALACGLACVPLVLAVRFDGDPLRLREPTSESVATYYDLLEDPRTSPQRLTVVASPAGAAQLAARLRELPEVHEVVSLDDFVPTEQDAKLALLAPLAAAYASQPNGSATPPDDPEARRSALEELRTALAAVETPVAASLAARIDAALDADAGLLVLRGVELDVLSGLPAQLDALAAAAATTGATAADLPADLRARWVAPDGRLRVEATPRANLEDLEALRAFEAAVTAIAPPAVGGPVTIVSAGAAAVRAFRSAFLYAFLAIAVVLIVLVRRPLDVLLVFAPLLLAGLLTGAALTLGGLAFNFANVISLPLLLGIGVDNGIHMVHRARLEPRRNILRTSTARSVFYSCLTTFCGFGSLAISPHPGTASLGVLLTLGVGFMLICTLVVLPALLAPRASSTA